ncbi:hypothetical protein NMG60_11024334 [Bertholletia excelsa]
MENCNETFREDKLADPGLQIIRHPPYLPCSKLSLQWFDLRVFYVGISNFLVDDSTPEFLTLNHIPLSPDTLLEVNGIRCSINSDRISSVLRRDRVDRKSEEATFVSTDSIRLTGSAKFEVIDKEDLLLYGVLEFSNSNGESKGNVRRWTLKCEPVINTGNGFLKRKHVRASESFSPSIEIYIAGCFSGTPIILTKTIQLSSQRRQNKKGTFESIPENKTTESESKEEPGPDLQVAEYRNYKLDNEEDYNMYWGRTDYMDREDGELSWFNAGVRVGVGISLGICIGVGVGMGLLVRTYHGTTRNFKRKLLSGLG